MKRRTRSPHPRNRASSGPKRILILMSDTGGGHRASAQALQAVFQERYPGRIQVDIIDLWMHHTPWPLNQLPKSYRFVTDHTPRLWKWAWRMSEKETASDLLFSTVTRWAERTIRQAFLHYIPDLVISVHPVMQHVPLTVLEHMGWSLPFVTVVTDLTTANLNWFHPGVDRCFVASQEAWDRARRAGLEASQLRLTGLPVRPAFARQGRPKAELRRELGLDPERRVVLLMSGGEGMGPVEAIARRVARELARQAIPGELVVICGRNQRLQERLSRRSWPIPVRVLGFVTDMPDWMGASDCIITKAGPGTIAEALICGLPILLSGYIPGQEEGNVPFVVEHGVGDYSEDPGEIARIVARWLGPDQGRLTAMSRRARALGHPQATYQIVDEIAAMVGVAPKDGHPGA